MNWPLIIISYLSLFVFGITDNLRGPIFPEIIKAFNVSNANASLIFASSSLSGFLISFISIYLLKKYSRRTILDIAAFVLFLTLIGFSIVTNFKIFVILSILFGMSSGVLGLIPNILVPIGSTEKYRQQFISGLHSMYGISSLLAPLLVAFLYSFGADWRKCFLYGSLFPLILIFYSFTKDKKIFDLNKKKSEKTQKEFFSKKHFRAQLFLAFVLCFSVICEVMLSSRFALFMQNEIHLGVKESSLYVSYFFTAMLLGRLLFTFKKFNYQIKTQYSVCVILTILFLYLGLNIHPLFIVFAGFFVSPNYPLMATFIAHEFPEEIDQSMSIVVAIDSIMLSLMHLLIGKLTDLSGIKDAMFSGIFFLLISIVLFNLYPYFFKRGPN
jgi:fucose permease